MTEYTENSMRVSCSAIILRQMVPRFLLKSTSLPLISLSGFSQSYMLRAPGYRIGGKGEISVFSGISN